MSDDKRSGGDGRKPPRGPKKPFGGGDSARRRGVDGDAPPRRSFGEREQGAEKRGSSGWSARVTPDRAEGKAARGPFRPREDAKGDSARPRKFEGRSERDGDRPFRPRPRDDGKDAPRPSFRPRGEERSADKSGDRPYRPFRKDDRNNDRPAPDRRAGEGRFRSPDERPARDGDRPFRDRRPETSFEERPRREGEGGRASFEPRFDERRESRPPPTRGAPRRENPRDAAGDSKPFASKPFASKPFASKSATSKPVASKPAASKPAASKPDASKPAAAKPVAAAAPVEGAFEGDRIAKVIARAGLGSRRDAEAWIEEGRVVVNGETLTSAARNVTGDDRITVDGKPLPRRERTRLWLYHKPRGLVTTEKDPEGRPTVFENLDPSLPRVMSVGRLDINTEGLLLLTNDGGLARQLELPKTGWLRRYRVRAYGETDQSKLDALFEGLTIDGVDYGRIEARLDKEQGANAWLTLGLREGKNREVKNVLASIGLDVNRLIRVSYGPFQLGDLAEGAVEEVKTRVLIDQLGVDLIAEAECEFEAPIFERPAPEAAKPAAAKPGSAKSSDEGYRRGLRVKAEEGGNERVMRGSLIEDRSGRRVLVQRVADIPEEKPAKQRKPYRDERGGDRPFKPRPSFRDRDEGGNRPRPSFKDRNEGGGDRPFKPRPSFRDRDGGGDRPFKPRPSFGDRGEGGDRPRPSFKDRNEGGGDRPFKPRPSFGDRSEGGDRPRPSFKDRNEGGGDRPFKPRPSFRDRDGGGDRPFKPRSSFRDRDGGGDRPFKPRPSFGDRSEGGDRPRPPFRERSEGGGDRPFKPHPSFRDRDEGGDRPRPPFRERSEGGGDRPFKPRPSFRDRDGGGDRPRPPFRERSEGGGDRPFKPRFGGGKGGPGGRPPGRGPRRGV